MTRDNFENLENQKFLLKKTTSIEEQIARYVLVTQKYAQKGYLEAVEKIQINDKIENLLLAGNKNLINELVKCNDLTSEGKLISDGFMEIFFDKYHWSSTCFVASDGLNALGSARLITKDSRGLPTFDDPGISIFDEYKFLYQEDCVEFSQFVVKDGMCTHISVGLLKLAYQYSMSVMRIKKWVATIDNSVLKFLNSRFFNFDLMAIGPCAYYLGSECTPVIIDLDCAIENSAKHESSRQIAEYILDNNNEGYGDIEIVY